MSTQDPLSQVLTDQTQVEPQPMPVGSNPFAPANPLPPIESQPQMEFGPPDLSGQQPMPLQPSGAQTQMHPDLLPLVRSLNEHRTSKTKNLLVNALSNFVFSLSQGMQAAASVPAGAANDRNRASAAFGAALGGGQQLQQMQQAQALQKAKAAQDQAMSQAAIIKAKADAQNADTMEKYRQSQDANLATTEVIDPITQQTVTIPMKDKASYLAKRTAAAALEQQQREKSDLSMFSKYGMIPNPDPEAKKTQPYIDAPDDKAPQFILAKRASDKALQDFRAAQTTLAQARTEVEKAKNDPTSPAFKLAQQRADAALESAKTAAGRLGLSANVFERDTYGTVGGQGVGVTDESGNPVGWKAFSMLRPTAATRTKAEQAVVINKVGTDLVKEIDQNRDMFGPAMGRIESIEMGMGSENPRVREFYSGLESWIAMQAALHGYRSQKVMEDFNRSVGGLYTNPDALKAGINAVVKGVGSQFQKLAQPGIVRAVQGQGGPSQSGPQAALAARLAAAKTGDVIDTGNGKVRKTPNGGFIPVK